MQTLAINKIERSVVNLKAEEAKEIAAYLNSLLANEFALFTKTLNFHWNVSGPRFHSLHNFLEKSYREQLEIMDDVAERVRLVGERPIGTVKDMAKNMDLSEGDNYELSSSQMLAELLKDNFQIQLCIKEILENRDLFKNDPGTEDFLVGLNQKHEMMTWMLKSHLD